MTSGWTVRDLILLPVAIILDGVFFYWAWTVYLDMRFQEIKMKMIQNPIEEPREVHRARRIM